MFAQDTGSAIRGAARADIYFGHGEDIPHIAGRIKQFGKFVMLVPKDVAVHGDPPTAIPLPKPRPQEIAMQEAMAKGKDAGSPPRSAGAPRRTASLIASAMSPRDGSRRRLLRQDERVLWTDVYPRDRAVARGAPAPATTKPAAEQALTPPRAGQTRKRLSRCRALTPRAAKAAAAAADAARPPPAPARRARQGGNRRPARSARADAKRGARRAVAFPALGQRARGAAGAGDHRQRLSDCRAATASAACCAGRCRNGWGCRSSALS